MEEQSALAYLRELGLTVDISEHTAGEIKGRLLVVHGKLLQGHFDGDPSRMTFDHFYAAYHAIAQGVVAPSIQDEVLEEMIPAMVENFLLRQQWRRMGDLNGLKRILRGPIAEWKGKRLLMASPSFHERGAPSPSPAHSTAMIANEETMRVFARRAAEQAPLPPAFMPAVVPFKPKAPIETVAQQIERLRQESDLTIEELAEKVSIDPTNVSRHIRGETTPTRSNRRKYEMFFSKLLRRQIVISRMQPKRS